MHYSLKHPVNVFLVLTAISTAANAQSDRVERAQASPAPHFVIVPDKQAMAAKQELLDRIARDSNASTRPPNIVLILADDLGYSDTGV